MLGHAISEATAHLSFQYPDGFKLKCVRREYVETATKGAKKEQQRVVYQTTHRSFNVAYSDRLTEDGPDAANKWVIEQIAAGNVRWNAPKGGNYNYLTVLYIDSDTNYIENMAIHAYSWADNFANFKAAVIKHGIVLTEDQQQRLDKTEKYSRHSDPEGWAKLDAKQAA